MGRLIRAKNKLARREGVDLGLKTFGTHAHASLLKRLNIVPGFKQIKKFAKKTTDYGRQLREKQKLKRIYGLSEKKLSSYFNTAVKKKGNTAQFLVEMLEKRLDNILYRLHFVPTRAAARQLVSHGHILVNGKKVDIASYQLRVGDKITFAKKTSEEIPYIKQILEEKNYILPKWLKREAAQGEVIKEPELSEYQEPVNLALVIEFYSKL